VPLVTALRVGGDEGRPVVATDPDSEAAQAFFALAERIRTDLAPKRIYRRELTIH
jgi:ATP-binding protein involved in chromosome partitioning